MIEAMYHTHAGSWIVLVIMFLLSYFLPKQKITPMILRLFYLVMIFTGGYMLFSGGYGGQYHLKAVLAIVLIGTMEMILARQKKGKSTTPFWIAMIVLLALVILIGYGVIAF